MFEEDYIMRLIKEMVRFILKLIFGINSESATEELLEDTESKEKYKHLQSLLDIGEINEAENELFDLVDISNQRTLAIALLFYSDLNEKDDDYLEAHDFSREEVRDGLQAVVSRFGLDGMADAFLAEE